MVHTQPHTQFIRSHLDWLMGVELALRNPLVNSKMGSNWRMLSVSRAGPSPQAKAQDSMNLGSRGTISKCLV
jgi:hypothetical protein